MVDGNVYKGLKFTHVETITPGGLKDINGFLEPPFDFDSVSCEVSNVGQVLTNFCILVRPHEEADWHEYIGGNDWSTKKVDILRQMEIDPKNLASGAKTFLLIKTGPVEAIKFQASIASGETTVTIKGIAGID